MLVCGSGVLAPHYSLSVRVRHAGCDGSVPLERMRTLPMRKATIKGHDGEASTYRGAWLKEGLKLDCASFSSMDKKTMVRSAVRVGAADGYSALIALTETDSSFRERPVMLAWIKNGKPMETHDGPFQLIVPDDMRHARDVRQVTSLEVITP